MKTLGLLRHAKSDWGVSDKRDFDRGLNDRGRRGAALIGAHIRDHGMGWDKLLASPAERVKQTLAAAQLEYDQRYCERLYLADVDTICTVIAERAATADAVLVCGHNPGLGDMVLDLVDPAQENALFDEAKLKYPTGAFAVIELDIEAWDELPAARGRLVHFKRPRDLDPDLGPEY